MSHACLAMPRKDFYGHKKSVHSVAWNCTGAQLASGSVDHSARIWTLDTTGFQVRIPSPHHTRLVDDVLTDMFSRRRSS